MAAVAGGLQDADQHIVHRDKKRAAEVDLQIEPCLSEHVLRRAHHAQQEGRAQDPGRCHQDAEDDADRHGSVYGPLRQFIPARPDKVRRDHAGAVGKPHIKPDQQIGQYAGGSHRRQGVRPQVIAHDQRVHRVVELLKKRADKNRQGK